MGSPAPMDSPCVFGHGWRRTALLATAVFRPHLPCQLQATVSVRLYGCQYTAPQISSFFFGPVWLPTQAFNVLVFVSALRWLHCAPPSSSLDPNGEHGRFEDQLRLSLYFPRFPQTKSKQNSRPQRRAQNRNEGCI